MGLTGGWRDNVNGWGKGLVLFGWFFMSAFVYATFALGIRGVQFYSPIPGLEFAPMLVTGLGFLVASRVSLHATGGYVFHMHMVMTLIVGTLMNWFRSDAQNAKMYVRADPNWKKLDLGRMFIGTLGMLLGYFLAPLVIWFFVSDYAVFIPHSPGAFPGFFPTGFNPWVAFAAEGLATFVLGLLLTYYALTGFDPVESSITTTRLDKMGLAITDAKGVQRANKAYREGLRTTAIIIAALIGLLWNVSGGCFDPALWVMEHVMVGIVLGQTPFTAAPFDDTNEYWWAYIFSAMIFMFFGVLAGYMWAGVDVGMYDEEDEKMYDGEQIREPMMDNARTGSSIAHKRSPAATGQRSAHDVDRLGAALFGADA